MGIKRDLPFYEKSIYCLINKKQAKACFFVSCKPCGVFPKERGAGRSFGLYKKMPPVKGGFYYLPTNSWVNRYPYLLLFTMPIPI